jgi:hypothetical protein
MLDLEDDTKLKIVVYLIGGSSVVAVIGIWEMIIKPVIAVASNFIEISW